ncbi:hypothetical protein ACFLQ8_03095, partial [Candidatus Auribacterota bacterium]
MSISLSEFQALAKSFFETVRDGIQSEEAIAEYFVYPHAQLVAPDGTCFSFAGLRALHQKFLNEKHILGDFELTQISDKPERARAKGWVYFETAYKSKPDQGLLRSIVGEEYILERGGDGKIRYVQYNSVFFA